MGGGGGESDHTMLKRINYYEFISGKRHHVCKCKRPVNCNVTAARYKTNCGPATDCTVRDRIPVGTRFSAPVQTGSGAQTANCTMGTGSFPGVKSGRGVTLTTHPLLMPWSRGNIAFREPQCLYSIAIPVLPLWAVQPVQSLSACTV